MSHRVLSALALSSVVAGAACSGVDAGVAYPDEPIEVDRFVVTPENESGASLSLSKFKISPEVCTGIDTRPIAARLPPDDLMRFLEKQGTRPARKARGNLYWFDFPDDEGGFVRLRLAVLDSAESAAKDLHNSLLEHGPGWWGVRRSNLAVLAPKADLSVALAFAIKHKLVCWGTFTIAGNDDAYVVPGPYAEL